MSDSRLEESMTPEAHRAIYHQLEKRWNELDRDFWTLSEDEKVTRINELNEIRRQMKREAQLTDKRISVPNKRCSQCRSDMESRQREPWWVCRNDPEHIEVKKTFNPDPKLTTPEWNRIVEFLTPRSIGMIKSVRCGNCQELVCDDGIPIEGWAKSPTSSRLYYGRGLLYFLGIKPWSSGTPDQYVVYSPREDPPWCDVCAKRTLIY